MCSCQLLIGIPGKNQYNKPKDKKYKLKFYQSTESFPQTLLNTKAINLNLNVGDLVQ